MPLSFVLCIFYAKIYWKNFKKYFFAHKKFKKGLQKVAYLWQLGGFYLKPRLAKTAQNFISKFVYTIDSAKVSDQQTICKIIVIFLAFFKVLQFLDNFH